MAREGGGTLSELRIRLEAGLGAGLQAWLHAGLGGMAMRRGTGSAPRALMLSRALFSLVWLIFLIVSTGVSGRHRGTAAWTGAEFAAIAAFGLCFIVLVGTADVLRERSDVRRPVLILMFVIAAAICVVYGGAKWNVLWIYVSTVAGLAILDRRMAARVVGLAAASLVVTSLIGHDGIADLLVKLLSTALIGFGMFGVRMRRQLVRELTQARETVVAMAANEERLRLARDMHDLTGQSLSMITLKSELAARLLERLPESADRDRARDEIEQVAAVSRQTLRDIREALSGYRRPTLAVEIITARAVLASAGITACDDADLTLLSGTFDPDAEAALAWCLREAVTNVVRHSDAKNCRISLTRRSILISLTVRDDGTGHAGGAASHERASDVAIGTPMAHPCGAAGAVTHGSGLHGMSERLSAVGGTLEVRPDLHPGFCLVATVPIAPPQPAPSFLSRVT